MRPDLATDQPFQPDPYRDFRAHGHVWMARGDSQFPLVIGFDDVRRTARNWHTFTSDTPCEVPIPHEHDVRSVRQLPIEVDPPLHTKMRNLVEERFSREAVEAHAPLVRKLATTALRAAVERGSINVADDLALPIVNYSLAATLGLPEDDVPTWLAWGTHVFYRNSSRKTPNRQLDDYLERRVDDALEGNGIGMFAELAAASVDGQPLERDELLGFGNLMFAGGRDTVVAGMVNAFVAIAHIPSALDWIRNDVKHAESAVEEILRVQSPLPLIGRHTSSPVQLGDLDLPEGALVGLGFAAANRDPSAFPDADRCRLDRQPNRHVAFGHGPHTCIGARLARMEMRVTLECLAEIAQGITIIGDLHRRHANVAGSAAVVGFEHVESRLVPRSTDESDRVPT